MLMACVRYEYKKPRYTVTHIFTQNTIFTKQTIGLVDSFPAGDVCKGRMCLTT